MKKKASQQLLLTDFLLLGYHSLSALTGTVSSHSAPKYNMHSIFSYTLFQFLTVSFVPIPITLNLVYKSWHMLEHSLVCLCRNRKYISTVSHRLSHLQACFMSSQQGQLTKQACRQESLRVDGDTIEILPLPTSRALSHYACPTGNHHETGSIC